VGHLPARAVSLLIAWRILDVKLKDGRVALGKMKDHQSEAIRLEKALRRRGAATPWSFDRPFTWLRHGAWRWRSTAGCAASRRLPPSSTRR
jgi:hypothetical protein